MHKPVRIFISSPGDVREERERARLVVEQLQRRYAGRLKLSAVLWEDLPLQADMPFQQGIELVLSEERGVDIAVFILWSRLGSPLGGLLHKADGSVYRSGTEREFDLMLQARQQSGGRKPAILAYVRQDDAGFKEVLSEKAVGDLETVLQQHKLVQQFIREQFHDPQTGANTRAYHTFQEPVSFATRLREHLRQQLDGLLPEETRPEARWEGAPFQGLELFQVEHADIFFGREQAVCDVQLALREQAARGCAFVLILGASGSGKSSLARAGVVASFIRDNLDLEVSTWRWGVLLPGAKPDELGLGLAQALAGALPELNEEQNSVSELGQALLQAPEVAFNLRLKGALRKAAQGKPGQTRVLLVVDQLEELFTQPGVSAQAIELLLKALEVLARSGSVWVLATMRSDFYARCQQFSVLLRLKEGKGQYDLLPPGAAELQRIITEPVWLAGLRYEQKEDSRESLDQRILNDAVKNPEALPLLEYLLRELYEHRSAEGLLTFKEYEQLGGVEGALGNRAEAVFLGLAVGVQAVLPEVLNALTTVNEEDGFPVTRQRTSLSEITDTAEKKALVERFLGERLFIADKGAEGTAVVQVAHEALLRGWERAGQWARDNREFLRSRKRVAQAHTRWKAEQESPDYLLPAGKPLAEAEALLLGHGNWLNAELRAFIQISSAALKSRERQRVKRAFSLITAVAVVLGFAGLFSSWQAVKARKSEHKSNHVAKFLQEMLQGVGPSKARGRDTKMLQEILATTAERVAKELHGEPEVELEIKDTIGEVYLELGAYTNSESIFRENLALRRKLFGNRHPDTATALNNLGIVLSWQNKRTEAESVHREALTLRRKLFGKEHPDVAASLNSLGNVLFAEERLSEAEDLFRQGLAMRRHLFGEESVDVAESLNDLSLVLKEEGRLGDAEAMQRQALAMTRKLHGEDHPNVGNSLNNLAAILSARGKLAETEALQRQELALSMRLLGKEHPSIAVSLNNLALCLRDQKKLPEAEAVARDALELRRRICETNNPDLAISLGTLASVLLDEGKLQEVESLDREALGLRQRVQGNDPDIADSLEDLSAVLAAEDKLSEAAEQIRESILIREKVRPDDWRTFSAKSLLGGILAREKRWMEAEPLLLSGYDGMKQRRTKISLEDQSCLIAAVQRLVRFYSSVGKPSEVVIWQRELGMLQTNNVVVVVIEIAPDGQARQIGLQRGDVLVRYSGEAVTSVSQLGDLIAGAKGPAIEMEIRRDGNPLKFSVKEGRLGLMLQNQNVSEKKP